MKQPPKGLMSAMTAGYTEIRCFRAKLFPTSSNGIFPRGFCEWDRAVHRPSDWEYWSPWELHELKLKPGEYFPRIARPLCSDILESPGRCLDFPIWQNAFASLAGQLSALVRRLQQICETVHPSGANLRAYGHEIRNLLILACTETETHWRGVLEANGVQATSTKDYIKLAEPLALKSYRVSFPDYPWLDPLAPFADWDAAQPTQSLVWYDAYNAVKHDREKNFENAQLGHAFQAVSACAILLAAQFGRHSSPERHPAHQILQFEQTPEWSPKDAYIPPYGSATSTAVHYPFETLLPAE